jgi:hypothetical protein
VADTFGEKVTGLPPGKSTGKEVTGHHGEVAGIGKEVIGVESRLILLIDPCPPVIFY